MPVLEGQSIPVTGAAQGLGAAMARHLHAGGARLTLMDRDAAGLATVAGACKGAVTAVVDLADADDTARLRPPSAVRSIRSSTMRRSSRWSRWMFVSLDTFQARLNVGIQAGCRLTRAVWPAMKARGGALVFVSSRSGIEGFADETAYCVGKHALEGVSKSLALEGAALRILSVRAAPERLGPFAGTAS